MDKNNIDFWTKKAQALLDLDGTVAESDLIDLGASKEIADQVIRALAARKDVETDYIVFRKPAGRG